MDDDEYMPNLKEHEQIRRSVSQLADRAAIKAVEQVFVNLGIDISDPIKAQAQFASLRQLAVIMQDKEFVEDLAWLRSLRTASEAVKDVSLRTVAKIVVTAILGILVLGTKDWWLSHVIGLK